MITSTKFEKDSLNKKLIVERAFNAPLAQVWQAWTDSEILDKWWAPKPYRAQTKTMDFTAGGQWIYRMVSPEGEIQWCRVDFKTIILTKSFTSRVAFSDESGKINEAFPFMYWENQFTAIEAGTKVIIEITFDKKEDMETIIAMGFENGFKAGLGNLDDYLATL